MTPPALPEKSPAAPPPIPARGRTLHHRAATGSLAALLLAVGLGLAGVGIASRMEGGMKFLTWGLTALIGILVVLGGVAAGIVALCGIPRHGKRGILIKSSLGVGIPLVVVLVFTICLPLILEKATGRDQVDRELAVMARVINLSTPLEMGKNTRLDHVEAIPGHKLRYHFTLPTMAVDDFPAGDFLEKVRPELVKEYSTSGAMEMMRRYRVTVIYAYRDKNGEDIGEVETGPEDLARP